MNDLLNAETRDPGTTSTSLLDRLRRRDPEGWRRHVQLYGPLVYRWCRRGRLRPEDAADVSQEVFRTVSLRIDDFRRDRPGDSFRGWLWTITRHKIGDYLRRLEAPGGRRGRFRRPNGQLNLPDQLPDDEEEAAGFSARSTGRWTWFGRSSRTGPGKPSGERRSRGARRDVAGELGVTPDAVRMAKSRVLRRLREELPDLAGDEGKVEPRFVT